MNYYFHSNFIYRTPYLPINKNKISVEELFNISTKKEFKEAIYLASPVLYDEMIKWHKKELTGEKEIEKLIISLFKYYNRMQTRCTPYGLFAACSSGNWGNESKLTLKNEIKRHTRLDMNYLCALAQRLNSHPSVLPLLRFFPNNSIYTFGDALRYVEYKYIDNRRVHQISSVDYSEYLKTILNKAENGASANELASLLVNDEITQEDAETFVKELIQTQILVSELEPAVTGDEFIHQIIHFLKSVNKNHPEINQIIKLLQEVQQEISEIDKQKKNDIEAYRNIYKKLKALETPIEENQLFQTDLYKSASHNTLHSSIQKELYEATEFLNRFTTVNENANLKKFKENFYNQYEDEEVSLLEALDTETGIGYTGKDISGVNDLLDDIFISEKESKYSEIRWSKHQQFLHNKLIQSLINNSTVVLFNDEEIKDLGKPTSLLPDSLSIMFRLVNDSKIYFQSCGGSSAANLLGRFAHGDEKVHSIINDITNHEQQLNTDKIIAEIIHLPESRVGNILLRPILRNYEIPFLGKSALPFENQIQLQDLMVSVKGNKIILRSKKLNKEIIPRLSTAHNYSYNALPVYQFLCDLQTQNFEKPGLGFSWGNLSHGYKFLPRAEYKNVILERAKWQLLKSDFQIFLDDKNPIHLNEITDWRKRLNMPQHLVLSEGDNELLVDLGDELSIKMFVNSIKKKERILLEEFLFETNNLLVKDQAGNGYTNEFIAILLKNEIQPETNTPSKRIITLKESESRKTIQRSFSIGSEWIYYKFYSGVKTADKFLTSVIKPLTEDLLEKKWVDKFFFIRYADPDQHIRLRFHISNMDKLGSIISLVNSSVQQYLDQGLITKIQTDTYKRELERYGSNSMELCESIFNIDSIAILNMLDLIDGDEGEKLRWQFAARSIDDLLINFSYNSTERLDLLDHLKEGFFQEHGGSKELKLQLDAKYRNIRKDVEDILDRTIDNTRDITPLIEILEWKNKELMPLAEKILKLKNSHLLQIDFNDLIASHIHMMLNRIFKARQRTFELVVYDMLYRYYKSLAGREKSQNKKTIFAQD